MTAEGDTCHTDLDVGVALALDHAPHEVVLSYQILRLHQVDPQHSLRAERQDSEAQVAEQCLPLGDSRCAFLPLSQILSRGWCVVVVPARASLTRRAPWGLLPRRCPLDPSQTPRMKGEKMAWWDRPRRSATKPGRTWEQQQNGQLLNGEIISVTDVQASVWDIIIWEWE